MKSDINLLNISDDSSSCLSKIMFTVDRCTGEARKPGDPADVWRAGADRDLQDLWESF